MSNMMSVFDLMPDEEAEKYRPIKSTDWKWTFADYPKEKNGIKVFSCFACGGGSTMGYKLARCEVIGDLEIDPKMNEIYVKNHHPKHNFLMDIRKFNEMPNEELPEELFHLDILDGSPPCTTFSMAGDRDDSWGKKKKFREGQAEQTLDDLSFVFIETVKKLQPKVVIMENVEGLLLGNAWEYVQRIYEEFGKAGYDVQHYLCKGENMGIPQSRHRVFFIGMRKDVGFNYESLDMAFNYAPVPFKLVKSKDYLMASEKVREIISNAIPNQDKCLAEVLLRTENRGSRYNEMIVWDDMVAPTVHTHGFYRGCDASKFTPLDYIHCQTFPEDYDAPDTLVSYICGMSVPPVMIKRIVTRIIETGVFEK